MTPLFLRRAFVVHVRGMTPGDSPGMDLAEFADFLLAWNSRGEAPSLRHAPFGCSQQLHSRVHMSTRVLCFDTAPLGDGQRRAGISLRRSTWRPRGD